MKDALWKEIHHWQWKRKDGRLFRIKRNEETGKWYLIEKRKKKWVIVEKNFRTWADAMICAEDKIK